MAASNKVDIRLTEVGTRLVLMSVAAAVLLAGVGYLPTRALAGPEAAGALFLGVGLALLAALAGLAPTVWAFGRPVNKRASGLLVGMVVRFVLVLGLLLAALLCVSEHKVTLALWTVIGHVALVVVDMFGILRYAGTARRCAP